MAELKTHGIKRWSGRVEDETPLCGADKWHPQVWGKRTEDHASVTCAACRAVIEKEERANG